MASLMVFIFLLCFSRSLQDGQRLYVDGVNGKDTNNGRSKELAFKTITHARDVIRQMKSTVGLPQGGVIVFILQTTSYSFIDEPFSLTEEDSGTEESGIMYYGPVPDESTQLGDDPSSWYARLTAGVHLNMDAVSPVTSHAVRSLLQESVRDKIIQVDLKKLGITDYGELASGQLGDCANNKLELFAEDMDMVLARYPNMDEAGTWQWMSAGTVWDNMTSFSYDTDRKIRQRILSWKNTSALWLHGYWSFDWADNYVKVDSVDKDSSAFVISSMTPPVYGFKTNARYYALNILEELDAENEYYLDRASGLLYMFATTAAKLVKQEKSCLSVGKNVMTLDSVSNVVFYGILADCSRSTAVKATNCKNVWFVPFGVERTGGSGIEVSGMGNKLVVSVSNTACGGVHLSGGDQKSLTPGGNKLTNSMISNWSKWKRTYQPALSWGGVGNTYTSIDIRNGPHSGVLGGDLHLENLCYETSDAGAFYTGRSWITRGNIIKHSTFKNVYNTEKPHLGAMSVQAIYLDDQMSGWTIHGNTFINCHVGVFVGGGRRNNVMSNKFVNCSTSVHVDNRGMTWQISDCNLGGLFDQQLKSVDYQQPPWSTHYPELVNIFQDHPCTPVYNSITGNTYCHGGQFIDISSGQLKEWMDTVTNNTAC